MKLLKHLINRIGCMRYGHFYHMDGETLGGWWVRCSFCHHLDEYLPGVHEPKGYKP